MDCIGRAQTLNLTFTIIATLRGGLRGTPQGAVGSARRTARNGTVLDVNFIILAKKLRPGGSPSDRFSLLLFAPVARVVRPLHFYFSFRIFLAVIILSSVYGRV